MLLLGLKKSNLWWGTSLMVQWSNAGDIGHWTLDLVRDLRPHMLQGNLSL